MDAARPIAAAPPPPPAAAKKKRPKLVDSGKYVLGPTLGRGSYGKVREGLNTQTLQVVVVKQLDKKRLRKTRGGTRKVEREVQALRRVGRSEHATELLGVVNEDSAPKAYLVLEYMPAGSLQQLLDRAPGKRLPLGQARRYFRQLVSALGYVHKKGVVHNDVKPANLLLSAQHVLKLSDFGCAEFVSHFTSGDQISRSVGSPAFQSPEIAGGADDFSGSKVDVWAAGVTLYQMVTGTMPFDADHLMELMEKIGSQDLVVPEDTPADLADLLRRILHKDETQRIDVAEILRHEWMQVPDAPVGNADEIDLVPRVAAILSGDYLDFDFDAKDGEGAARDDSETDTESETEASETEASASEVVEEDEELDRGRCRLQ